MFGIGLISIYAKMQTQTAYERYEAEWFMVEEKTFQLTLPVIGLTNFPLLCKFYKSIPSITSIFQLEVKHKQLEEWCSNLCVRLAHIKELYVQYPAFALS